MIAHTMYDMTAKLKRINARIPTALDQLLQELAHVRGVSLSEVVVTALNEFCEKEVPKQNKSLLDSFRKAGLVGCFKGGKKLSSEYKKLIGESLDDKWK